MNYVYIRYDDSRMTIYESESDIYTAIAEAQARYPNHTFAPCTDGKHHLQVISGDFGLPATLDLDLDSDEPLADAPACSRMDDAGCEACQ